jgi:hypothetical protein|tara:strand:- start:754 stop:1176 length:423 start_codon:yes stop_codon:yes gene_type:complete
MPVDTNNIHVEECIKENRVDGETTSLTIKLVAYDLDDLVKFTGDGTYLSHDDCSWEDKTQVGKIYYDFNSSSSLASKTMNYTLPADKRTTQVQTKNEMNAPLSEDQTAQRNIRAEWFDLFQATEEYSTMRTELGTALANL